MDPRLTPYGFINADAPSRHVVLKVVVALPGTLSVLGFAVVYFALAIADHAVVGYVAFGLLFNATLATPVALMTFRKHETRTRENLKLLLFSLLIATPAWVVTALAAHYTLQEALK